jgi:hypothetical protein
MVREFILMHWVPPWRTIFVVLGMMYDRKLAMVWDCGARYMQRDTSGLVRWSASYYVRVMNKSIESLSEDNQNGSGF